MNSSIKVPYSILFIEDEISLRKNFTQYLKKYFQTIYEAGDGIEAFEKYKQYKPDILIVDINIPKMDGLSFLEKVRKFDHSVKAIVLTAHCDNDSLLKATHLKLTNYLIKPISRVDLRKSINEVLQEIQNFTVVSNNILVLKNGFIWDLEKKKLYQDNKEIQLTMQEIKMMTLFTKNINIDLFYNDICYYLWEGYFNKDKTESLKTAIKKLRRKLPPGLIINIYGQGYIFRP